MLGRPDASRRFLLEAVEHPDFIRQLHGVNDAERIALGRQRDLKYTGADTVQRLGNIALPLGRDRECGEAMDWAPAGKLSNTCSAVLINEMPSGHIPPMAVGKQ